jgi:hypothetical protein
MIASGLNIIAGIWLIISPFVLGYWNPSRTGTSDQLSWVNVVLGLWLIVSTFVWASLASPRLSGTT